MLSVVPVASRGHGPDAGNVNAEQGSKDEVRDVGRGALVRYHLGCDATEVNSTSPADAAGIKPFERMITSHGSW